MASNRRTNRTAYLLVVIIGIGLSGCQASDTASSCNDSQFNSASWKSQASWSGRPSLRQRMAGDLLRCKTLVGRTEAETIRLLGRPEHPGRPDEDGPCYELGPQRDLGGLDNEVMCLTFDAHQKVKQVEVVTF